MQAGVVLSIYIDPLMRAVESDAIASCYESEDLAIENGVIPGALGHVLSLLINSPSSIMHMECLEVCHISALLPTASAGPSSPLFRHLSFLSACMNVHSAAK